MNAVILAALALATSFLAFQVYWTVKYYKQGNVEQADAL